MPTRTAEPVVPPIPAAANVVIGPPTPDEVATLVGLAIREIDAYGGPGASDEWLSKATLPDALTSSSHVWFVDPSDPDVSQYARVLLGRVALVRRSARALESARARQHHLRTGGSADTAPPLYRDQMESWASMFWDALHAAACRAQQLAEQLALFEDQ